MVKSGRHDSPPVAIVGTGGIKKHPVPQKVQQILKKSSLKRYADGIQQIGDILKSQLGGNAAALMAATVVTNRLKDQALEVEMDTSLNLMSSKTTEASERAQEGERENQKHITLDSEDGDEDKVGLNKILF